MTSAIIFDADGTIIDTEHLWDKAHTQVLGRRGLQYKKQEVKHKLTGRNAHDSIKIIQETHGFEENVEKMKDETLQVLEKIYISELNWIPGFIDFFNACKGKYKMAVGTAMPKNSIQFVDKKLNIYRLFDGYVYSVEDAGNKSKPNPAVFLHAAKMLDEDPSDCLVFEDAISGVQAAKNAGMKCIALTTSHPRKDLENAGADHVIDGYSEVNFSWLQ